MKSQYFLIEEKKAPHIFVKQELGMFVGMSGGVATINNKVIGTIVFVGNYKDGIVVTISPIASELQLEE